MFLKDFLFTFMRICDNVNSHSINMFWGDACRKEIKQMQTVSSLITKLSPIIESQLAYSAWRSEKSRLNIINRKFGHYLLKDLTKTEIVRWVNEPKPSRKKHAPHRPWSPKTRNAYLSLMRKILNYAVDDNIISKSPLERVDFYTLTDSVANPFRREEIARIVSHELTCPIARWLFAFGVLTGLRMSELIALSWNDVDFSKKVLYVMRAKPLADDDYKTPKTHAAQRSVELSDAAIQVLRDVEPLTHHLKPFYIRVKQRDNFSVKKMHVRFVFINSMTQKPFLDSKQYAKTFFTPMLRSLDIEHRGPSQIRHTFASQAITMGLPKEWVRRQLGHTDDTMINRHYAEWIAEDADDHSERYSRVMKTVFEQSESDMKTASSSIDKASASIRRGSFLRRMLKALFGGKNHNVSGDYDGQRLSTD